MTREQYNDERQAIIDDYVRTGQHWRYSRDIAILNWAAERAGLFADSTS